MPGRGERTAEGCRRDARDRAGEALGALGHMQFAQRIALLAHDALLSRRRDVPVDLSGEVAHRASVRHRHVATAPNNSIRHRRIEFNNSLKRTAARGTPRAVPPPCDRGSDPPRQPSARSRSLLGSRALGANHWCRYNRRMTRDFDVIVERDAEGYYVASVPSLHGCHTQAKSLDELMVRVKEVIELCLEVQGAPGEPLDFIGVQRIRISA